MYLEENLLHFHYLQGSDAQQWANCKTELSKILVNQCSGTKVLKVTILISNEWFFVYLNHIYRLATCTIVKKEGELNVVFKMKSVKRIGLKLMIRLMLTFSKIRIWTIFVFRWPTDPGCFWPTRSSFCPAGWSSAMTLATEPRDMMLHPATKIVSRRRKVVLHNNVKRMEDSSNVV